MYDFIFTVKRNEIKEKSLLLQELVVVSYPEGNKLMREKKDDRIKVSDRMSSENETGVERGEAVGGKDYATDRGTEYQSWLQRSHALCS